MTLNDEKAQILFTVRGILGNKLGRHSRPRSRIVLFFRSKVRMVLGTLVKSTVYLGAKISYD